MVYIYFDRADNSAENDGILQDEQKQMSKMIQVPITQKEEIYIV